MASSNDRDHWYRKTTWSSEDQDAFFTRLKRCRADSKPQYVRIQALYLSDAGLHKESLGLSNYFLAEYTNDFELSSLFLTRAQAFEAVGELDSAIQAFRSSLAAERARPNIRTSAWLDFGLFAIMHGLEDLYPEVESVLEEFSEDSSLVFPKMRFDYLAVQAHLYEKSGELVEAAECAREALESAKVTHSGFSRHSDVGLVRDVPPKLLQQLNRLASGRPSRPSAKSFLDVFKFGKR